MKTPHSLLPCDGCGLPASPEHIAERVRRLELSTRFRPVHIGILFVELAPPVSLEVDFYAAPDSELLKALGISATENLPSSGLDGVTTGAARLAEFQRRGYHLAYLSECPLPASGEAAAEVVARLASTLIRRIRFNYKPKQIAPLGPELRPVIETLRSAGIGGVLTLDQAQPLPVPGAGCGEWLELFQGALAIAAPRENLPAGYDRI